MWKCVFGIIFAVAIGVIIGMKMASVNAQSELDRRQELADKHLDMFLLMYIWVKLKQESKSLENYFKRNNFQIIAVYGISYVGECLLKELEKSSIQIQYTIDNVRKNIFSDVKTVTIDGELEHVDVIVVTAITFYDEIYATLSDKTDIPVVSLQDVLMETYFDT